jgi:predicted enzyme related to lactoylglutathione lyase
MKLISLRMITPNLKQLVRFYEQITGLSAQWYTDDFAEIATSTITLAIGSTRTMSLFGEGLVTTGTNNSVIIEFQVGNVDEEFERVKDITADIVQAPTTMPWGNRSLLFRDPDGNFINFFTPVTAEAIKKFS